jgi:uncharacterized protein (TIGR02452 family)
MKSRDTAELGRETLSILERGAYDKDGRTVPLKDQIRLSVERTTSHPPDEVLSPRRGSLVTRFEVTGETTLAASRRLYREGALPLALNFASAKNPGGGFLGGAIAQEESLARSSALYACLSRQPMYTHHRAQGGGWYTHWALFSPAVPVFRDDQGALLDEPWPCSFLTCAAVNAGVVREKERIEPVMRERTLRVLAVAAHHGAETLVLGAWGCGVFKNDPAMVAGHFRDALTGPFAGAFARVVFAVYGARYFIAPFESAFC